MSRRLSLAVVVALVVAARVPAQENTYYHMTGDPARDRVFQQRMRKAGELAGQRKFGDAVKEIVWCLDNRFGSDAQFESSGTRALVQFLRDIDRLYSPAGKLLKKRRKQAEKKFRAGEGSFDDAHELHEINLALYDEERTLELYDELEDGDNEAAAMRRLLFLFVEEEMITEERYKEFLAGAGNGHANLDRRLDDLAKAEESYTRQVGKDAVIDAKGLLCRSAARYYEALLATGKEEKASRLADRFLALHKSGATYSLFMRCANRLERREAAIGLRDEALETLPKTEHPPVKREAKYIPKKKKK